MIQDISDLNRLLTSKRCCILFISLFLMAPLALAGDTFWDDRKRGYFWYEDPILEAPKDEDRYVKNQPVSIQPHGNSSPDSYSYEDLFDLHPDRFQVVIDTRLKHAVHRPTEENVLRFLEAADVAKKKSRMMASVAGYVAMQNPRLTGESRYPYSQPGRSVFLQQRSTEIKANLDNFKDQYAIIAFNKAGCGYCEAQEEILARFENLYGWIVRRIDIGGNPQLAAKFEVEITPTLLLVSRATEASQIISSGVISFDELNKRIYQLVRLMEGRTDPKQFYNMDFYKASE